MNQESNPNFYAIIPADVRYDKDLPPNAKLLYGEISALTSKEGFCWASNEYFSKLYDVDKNTISRWVSALKEKGYIRVEITDRVDRKIYIANSTIYKKDSKDIQKDIGGSTKKTSEDIQKDQRISTEIKTKNNTIIKEEIINDHETLKRGNDPFAINFDSQNASIVFDEIKKYTIEKFKTKPSPDPLSCSDIASRCIAENENDLREEIRYKLEIYEYCQFFSEKFAPAPKRILQAWDQLIDTALPEHKRRIRTPIRSEPIQDDDAPIMEFLEEEPISEEQKKRNLEEIDKVIKKSKL